MLLARAARRSGGVVLLVFLTPRMGIVLLVCIVWARVLDHAFWWALGLSRAKALLAVLVHDVAVLAPGVAWYVVTDQIQPWPFGVS